MKKITLQHLEAALMLIIPALFALLTATWIMLFNYRPTFVDLGTFLLFYFINMIGIEIGYHRLFSHRAFTASKRVETIFAIMAATAYHGPIMWWVGIHKQHHRFTDNIGDPHSPNTHRQNRFRGFLHAHLGWLLNTSSVNPNAWSSNLRYLYSKPNLFHVHLHYYKYAALGLVMPFLLGLFMTSSLEGAATAFLWGGPIRIFVVSHLYWSINSLGHSVGSRPFTSLPDQSTNNLLLAIPTIGAAWHHNHHAYPRAASLRFRWWQIDIGYVFICLLKALGLVRDVVIVTEIEVSESIKHRFESQPK